VPDGTGAACDQHDLAPQRPIPEQRTMRGQGRDAKTGPEPEAGGVGKRDGLLLREAHPLLGRPILATPGGEVDPDPLADPTGIHAVADRIDLTGTVLVGHHERGTTGESLALRIGLRNAVGWVGATHRSRHPRLLQLPRSVDRDQVDIPEGRSATLTSWPTCSTIHRRQTTRPDRPGGTLRPDT
jgi:hypothetical protein